MMRFEDYAGKYKHIQMERPDGILQMRLHTDGGTLHWGEAPHAELGQCYYDMGSDSENRAVIVASTGEYFNARCACGPQWELNPRAWDHIYWDGKNS